jgi:hypothetical protein
MSNLPSEISSIELPTADEVKTLIKNLYNYIIKKFHSVISYYG